jgi:type IV secretory pathway TrbD component
MIDRAGKNRIHVRTAVVFVLGLLLVVVAYFLRTWLKTAFGMEAWMLLLVAVLVITLIRVVNIELGVTR